MKTIFLIAICLLSSSVFAQNFGFTVGTPMQGQQIRGGFIIDSVLKMPIKDTVWPAAYTSVTPEACLVFNRDDHHFYYNDSLVWQRVLSINDANSLFLTSVPSQSFTSLTGKPTTLSGYGVTDAYPLTGNPSGFITSEVDGSITNEIELPSQTSSGGKFLQTNGASSSWQTALTSEVDGSITNEGSISVGSGSSTTSTIGSNTSGSATITISSGEGILVSESGNTITIANTKRQETYTGTTNSSGIYTVTYASAYSVVPNIQYAVGVGGLRTYSIILTASSTTGFTVKVENRTDIAGLLPSFANVNGQTVDVLVTEK